MDDPRTETGRAGEDAALAVYRRRGYRTVARNWRCRIGELDLVVTRDDTLVFCEVKARRGAAFGGGFEAVTHRKRAKLRAVAQAFVIATGATPDSIRFDVASVRVAQRRRGPLRPTLDGSSVDLFEDAF